MKVFKFILPVLLLASPLLALAQQTKILTADKHNDYGLVYTLPLTALKINVKVTKKTTKAGPYYQYAKKFLGISNVVKEDAVMYTISQVTATPVGLKDDQEKYLMQVKPGSPTFIGVDADGMILSINVDPVSPPKTAETPKSAQPSRPLSVDDYLQYVDMDFVASQSSVKQAEMIANSLMEVRDAYLSLTRGTADNTPTDGKQLELMLNSLKQQEDALTMAFTGTSFTETEERDFLFIPEKDGREILFRLSDFGGYVDADDYSGVPVYITTEILLEGKLPVDENGQEKKLPKDAVIYALPGVAKITIACNGSTFFEAEGEFSQFGTKFGLNPTLFSDKKERSYARFNPATGALEELGVIAD